MGTAGLSQQSDKRRKRVTVIVAGALAVAVLTVAGAYWRGRSHQEKAGPAPPRVPANVKNQLSGYTYTQSEDDRRIFTVHAARTMAFNAGGSTILQDVYVEVFGSTGTRHDVLRTEECDYNPDSGDLTAGGKVNIELNGLDADLPQSGTAAKRGSQPVFVETSKVSFKQKGTLMETHAAVKFRSGLASGTAQGMIYDARSGLMELEKNVVLKVQPLGGPRPSPEARLTASRLLFEKDKGRALLSGPIEISQGTQSVSAGHGTILMEGDHRVTHAVLEEGVRGTDTSALRQINIHAQEARANFDAASGQLQSVQADGGVDGEMKTPEKILRLTSQQLELAFSGIHPRPVSGRAAGNVNLAQEPGSASSLSTRQPTTGNRPGEGREDFSAAEVQFSFRPEQQTLQKAETVGMGHLALVPSSPESGGREVFAEPLVMDFDASGRMETLRGLSRVRVIFHPSKVAAAGTQDQETSSNSMKATLDPATGSLIAAEQKGDFQFHQGERQGSAEQAAYASSNQTMTLTGSPQLLDPDSRLRAERITVDLQTNTAEGLGHVKSSQLAAASPADKSGKRIPTNVLADRVLARRDSQFVHYEGHVHAWHGEDVLESPALDVYKAERRISSTSGVLTSYLEPPPADPHLSAATSAAPKESRLVTIRADRLDYSDEGRRATYAGHAELHTEDSTLRSDRLQVFLSTVAGPSQVDRAVADGRVTVVQPGRHATGDHGEYDAALGKILLTGGPPTVYDAAQGFTTGRSLTLFLHDDTIFVDGGEKSPTLSKHRISP